MYEYHTPVLKDEVIEFLKPHKGDKVIDCTFGFGGHSQELLKKISKKGKLIGIDQSLPTIKIVKEKFSEKFNGYDWDLFYGNFRNLTKILNRNNFDEKVDIILFDLGISSYQIDKAKLGISFLEDEYLDMRMSKSDSELTAARIVNKWSEEQLIRIFSEYGEERFSRRIARAIVANRKKKFIKTSKQLVDIVLEAVPKKFWPKKKHPATKIFQALRIAANDELEAIKEALPQALSYLKPKGRLGIITFHSLEDKIVKNFFRQESRDCICDKLTPTCICNHKKTLKIITKKSIKPSDEEISQNPRSRSAQLRVAEKI